MDAATNRIAFGCVSLWCSWIVRIARESEREGERERAIAKGLLLSYYRGRSFGRSSFQVLCTGGIVVVVVVVGRVVAKNVSEMHYGDGEKIRVKLSLFSWYHLCLGCGEYMGCWYMSLSKQPQCSHIFSPCVVKHSCPWRRGPARCAHELIVPSGCKCDIFGGWLAWLACMENVGAWRVLGECLARWTLDLEMWSLAMPWYWGNQWNAGKGRSHWNYFNKCNRKVCTQTLLILWGCWIQVLV